MCAPLCNKNGGIDACIGEKGHGISEGQARGLPARAILRDAPILLLDEATSGRIIETEQLIIRNIIVKGSSFNRSCGAKKTCIVATHRPSILALCDKIFRVQDAKITLGFRRGSGKLLQRRAVTPARVYSVFV